MVKALVVHQNETAGLLAVDRPVFSARTRVSSPHLYHVGTLEIRGMILAELIEKVKKKRVPVLQKEFVDEGLGRAALSVL